MQRTKIVGIVNITPDSFSDGGAAFNTADATARIYTLAEQGADIIDIGAESTRPGAKALTSNEEWARLEPVLLAIARDMDARNLTISIDTYHAQTAARALEMGVHIINDVSGLRDAKMRHVLAGSHCDIIAMHALSIPVKQGETLPEATDMVAYLNDWVQTCHVFCNATGIRTERLTFDPGLGFGKTPAQSVKALHAVMMREHHCESWLIGHSRKSFLNLYQPLEAAERDGLTRSISAMLMLRGVTSLRVHDVAGHVALRKALA